MLTQYLQRSSGRKISNISSLKLINIDLFSINITTEGRKLVWTCGIMCVKFTSILECQKIKIDFDDFFLLCA